MVITTNSHNLATFSTEDIMRHKRIARDSLESEKEYIGTELYERKRKIISLIYPEISKQIISSSQVGLNKSLNNDEEINRRNLEMWLGKKMIEQIKEGRTFSKSNEFAKLKKEKGLEGIKDDKLEKMILSGEVVLEKYVKYSHLGNYGKVPDKKLLKNINSIKSNFASIVKIINNDIKKHHYFLVEHLGDITPLIENIQKSLRILNKVSDKLDDNFKELKDELVKGLNIDEGFIKSCLFQINQVINTL